MSDLSRQERVDQAMEEAIQAGRISREEANRRLERMSVFVNPDAPLIQPGQQTIGPPRPGADTTRPVPPEERRENFRPASVFAGAMAGAQIGSGLGVPGMIAGGALGAAEGSLLFDSFGDLQQFLGKDVGPRPTMMERVAKAGEEATLDAAFTAGTSAIYQAGRLALRAGGRVFSGLGGPRTPNPEAVRLLREAEEAGVDIGAMDASQIEIVSGFGKIVGRFPFIGGPIKKEILRKANQVQDASQRLSLRIGPSATMAASGIDLKKHAGRRFKAFSDQANRLYDRFRLLAEETGATIPTEQIRGAAQEYIEKRGAQTPIRVSGEPLNTGALNPFDEWARQVTELPEQMPMTQYQGFMDQWDELMGLMQKDGFSTANLMNIKTAAEADLQNIVGPDEVVQALKTADDYFASTSKIFETATAKKIGRVDKNLFRKRFEEAGTIEADQLRNVIVNTKSPQALQNLRRLVGNNGFRSAVSGNIQDTFNKAIQVSEKEIKFNANQVRQTFGLDDTRSNAFAATQEMLKGTGVRMRDIRRLIDVTENVFKDGLPDPSAFVARRGMLGGARSALNVMVPGAAGAAAGGFPGAAMTIAGVFGVRHIGKLLVDPGFVRNLTTSLRPKVPSHVRNAAFVRVIRAIDNSEEENAPQR